MASLSKKLGFTVPPRMVVERLIMEAEEAEQQGKARCAERSTAQRSSGLGGSVRSGRRCSALPLKEN